MPRAAAACLCANGIRRPRSTNTCSTRLEAKMDFPRTRRRRIEISLIPLIDVSMFLLIFFMVAGSIERFEVIPVEPPVAASGKLMDEGHVLILLGKHDEIIIDDEIVPMEEMQKRLQPQLAAN